MENNQETQIIRPPGLIASITEGFNIVASNIHLILLPLIFDIFLWLGPHLRIKVLLRPFIFQILNDVPDMTSSDLVQMSEWSREIWVYFLDHFNILSMVRVYPVGIPSLMTGLAPIDTPFGQPSIIEVSSLLQVTILWVALSLLGIILGSLYFDSLSRATDDSHTHFSLIMAIDYTMQVFIFTLLCFILLFFFLIPTLILILLLALISMALGQIAFIFISILMIWFIMPLFFSVHGVFVDHQSLYSSITTSVRLVRNYLPGTGLFVLIALLLYQGLNLLWQNAPETSWMTIAGIFGHAFISTGLITSSFVYYRKGLSWMKSRLHPVAA